MSGGNFSNYMQRSECSIIAGLDLPFEPNCGSVIFAHDLYTCWPTRVCLISLESLRSSAKLSDQKYEHVVIQNLDRLKASNPVRYQLELANQISGIISSSAKIGAIHVHHLTFGFAAAISLLKPATPVIAFCHGTDLIAASHEGRHLRQVEQTCALSERIISPTVSIADKLVDLVGSKVRKKIRVIPWGLPDSYYIPVSGARICPSPKQFKILFAGRNVYNKGLSVLDKALNILPDGFSGDAYSEEMGVQTEGHPCLQEHKSRLKIRPFLSRYDLQNAFDNYHCLVLPTIEIEAFGLVALEAQARGLPVVASDLSSIREVLGNGALYFRPGDPGQLAECLIRLADDSSLYQHLKKSARKNAERYSLHQTVKMLIEL